MYSFIVMAHSGWRYVVVAVLFVALVKYIVGWIGNREWSNLDTTLSRVTPITLDIQLLLGLVIWIMGSWWNSGMAGIAWEHPVILTLAVVLSHGVAWQVKKIPDSNAKYRMATLAYIGILVLIAVGLRAVLGSMTLFGSGA